jgi:hypothetical protein
VLPDYLVIDLKRGNRNTRRTGPLKKPSAAEPFQKKNGSLQRKVDEKERPVLTGFDLDDFHEGNTYYIEEFFPASETFLETHFCKIPYVKLSDFNLPFKEPPDDSYYSSSLSMKELGNLACTKCKEDKLDDKDILEISEDGYFQGSLEWTLQWEAADKQRILVDLERENRDLALSQTLGKSADFERNAQVLIEYFMQHHDWLSLQNVLQRKEVINNEKLIKILEKSLPYATNFLSEEIRDYLATKQKFLGKEQSDIILKIRRIARISSLFRETNFIEKMNPTSAHAQRKQEKSEDLPSSFLNEKGKSEFNIHFAVIDHLVRCNYFFLVEEYLYYNHSEIPLERASDRLNNVSVI